MRILDSIVGFILLWEASSRARKLIEQRSESKPVQCRKPWLSSDDGHDWEIVERENQWYIKYPRPTEKFDLAGYPMRPAPPPPNTLYIDLVKRVCRKCGAVDDQIDRYRQQVSGHSMAIS